ncbi:hypothetical protein JXC34_01230, partial [Candidatus Woesearchaeota archaeon]|nr:hypothetical protein [Candidatus Woesearchaeota archaeon]
IQKALKQGIDEVTDQEKGFRTLTESRDFFEQEFKCKVEVMKAEDSTENKAKQALPNKPALLVE